MNNLLELMLTYYLALPSLISLKNTKKKKNNRMLSATIFLRTSRVSVVIIGSTVPHMLRRAGVSY